MMNYKNKISTLAIVMLTSTLIACQPQGANMTITNDIAAGNPNSEIRLSTEAQTAITEGRSKEALATYERKFKNSAVLDDQTLINYSQLLRNDGKPRTAMKIISKYALDDNGNIKTNHTPVLLNELAANKIENGEFKEAASIVSKVLENESLGEIHADAYNLMGISLDAQGKHSEAEVNFRMALNEWKGSATSVKNNLAVCLASQGKFDEALILLRQALIESPEKDEISKNIELINSIRESLIPKPHKSKI